MDGDLKMNIVYDGKSMSGLQRSVTDIAVPNPTAMYTTVALNLVSFSSLTVLV